MILVNWIALGVQDGTPGAKLSHVVMLAKHFKMYIMMYIVLTRIDSSMSFVKTQRELPECPANCPCDRLEVYLAGATDPREAHYELLAAALDILSIS